ncbi:uncharacterized protein LOC134696241 [Mytilus trossulus]|uniref:uncharacterized protein LOC134696241 n=1 Tax=Mytilus trossulus TaxID=6551 RepID=UPI003004FF0E
MDETCRECSQQQSRSYNLTFKTCLKCHQSVCIMCQTKHERRKDNHSFRHSHFQRLPYFCSEHTSELLNKYCINCSKAVCGYCYRKYHESHKIKTFNEVANDRRRGLKKEKDSVYQELKKVIKQTEKGHDIYRDFDLQLKCIYSEVESIVVGIRHKQAEILNYASYGKHTDIDAFLKEMFSLMVCERIGNERYRVLHKIDKERDDYKFISYYQKYSSWLQQCVSIPIEDSTKLQPLKIRYNKPFDEEVRQLLINIEVGPKSKSKQKNRTSGNSEEERTMKLLAVTEKDKIIEDLQIELQIRGQELSCMRKAMQFMNENTKRPSISNTSVKMKLIEHISDYPQVLETIQEFQSNMGGIKQTMDEQDLAISQLEKEIKVLEHASKKGPAGDTKRRQQDVSNVDEQSKLMDKVEDLEIILQSTNIENEHLRHNLASVEFKIDELQASYDILHKKHSIVKQNLDTANRESEDLKTRLSQIAGAKLVAGNSCIADLGDKYRPTKIAEMFSELYDTEWTDAVDKLMSSNKDWSEDLVVRHLFIVLQVCYRTCSELAKQQLNSTCKILFLDIPSEQMAEQLDRHITEVKQIRDARKGFARDVSQFLIRGIFEYDQFKKECKKYKELDQELLSHIRKTEFTEKCVMVCWLMVVQDPEMFIDDDMSPSERFNKDIYREYTQSGTKIAFSVWPALYLKKGGPLLSKGVVQVTN